MSMSAQGHETVLDVRQEQLARIYARAFVSAAVAAGKGGELVEELDSLATDVLDRNPEFDKALTGDVLSEDEATQLIDRVFKGRASEEVVNLLKIMAHHRRLGALRMVVRMVHKLWGESQGRREVVVRTATELTEPLRAELTSALKAKLGIDAELIVKVDPELIAGMVVQVGDTIYDGSVRTSLERTRREMVERAIDAIEKQPEKFLLEIAP